jgi:hypothetical protein
MVVVPSSRKLLKFCSRLVHRTGNMDRSSEILTGNFQNELALNLSNPPLDLHVSASHWSNRWAPK